MLRFLPDLNAACTVLCLGAHSDDIEIGCGGTLVELRKRYVGIRFVWVVFSADPVRELETRAAARSLMTQDASLTVEVRDFRGSYFPYTGSAIKDAFEELSSRIVPDLIFTHYLDDRHQDHRVVSELTWNTFRNHAIFEYEIPKYDGDLAQPGVFCSLSPETVDLKVATLLESFPSQRERQWFDADLFRGHLHLRGIECNSPTRFAEAFHARKILI